MGEVRKRGRIYWIRYYRNGRRLEESARTTSYRDARALLRRREREVDMRRPELAWDDSQLTEDDRRRLQVITLSSGEELLALVREYWQDGDRADRTPRSLLYLHLGMLAGLCHGLLLERGRVH